MKNKETADELRARLFSDISRPYQMYSNVMQAAGGSGLGREIPPPDTAKMALDLSAEQVYQLARIADALEKKK